MLDMAVFFFEPEELNDKPNYLNYDSCNSM